MIGPTIFLDHNGNPINPQQNPQPNPQSNPQMNPKINPQMNPQQFQNFTFFLIIDLRYYLIHGLI